MNVMVMVIFENIQGNVMEMDHLCAVMASTLTCTHRHGHMHARTDAYTHTKHMNTHRHTKDMEQ